MDKACIAEGRNRDHYVFSRSRRFCADYQIPEASFFIALSRIMWDLDFSAPVDPETGHPKIPDINDEEFTWSSGFSECS